MGKNPIEAKLDFQSRMGIAWPTPNWQDVSVLVAVSGGADSVALASALHSERSRWCEQSVTPPRGRLEIAHFNHRWRGEDSDLDEQFVRQFCDEKKLTCHVGQADESKQSEEVARNERYAFLHSLAKQRGARYIAMAHTANDQVETVLHRVVRGTGLRGLRGIQFARRLSEAVTVVRPLLWARRDDVLRYLESLSQTYRDDSSNQNTDYTRNRIRLELLPHLAEQYNGAVHDSLLRLSSIASDALSEIQPIAKAKLDSCYLPDAGRDDTQADWKTVSLDRALFLTNTQFMQREILQQLWRERQWPAGRMTFDHWNRMVDAICEGTALSLPAGVQLRTDERTIVLCRPMDTKQDH